MPHDDKQYLKKLRTIKLVAYMVLSALAALLVGLVLVGIFDKAPDSPFTHGWNLFFVIVFALLVAGLQIPTYIADIRKIEMGNPIPAQPQKPKPYAVILEQARKTSR